MVETGAVHCARCGQLIAADAPWDLGHRDGFKDEWWGLEHQRCKSLNRASCPTPRHVTPMVNPVTPNPLEGTMVTYDFPITPMNWKK